MPELRSDLLSGANVIFAPRRNSRPDEFIGVAQRLPDAICPFCGGHENQTPPGLLTLKNPDSANDWDVRVVNNLYPFLNIDDPATDNDDCPSSTEAAVVAQRRTLAHGVHEVTIESNRHVASLTEMPKGDVGLVMLAYHRRITAMRTSGQIHCPIVFKNCRRSAGASVEHAHSQIVGLRSVPARIRDELDAMLRFQQRYGHCALCVALRLPSPKLPDSLSSQRWSIVDEDDNWLAACPWASRFPFEIWIAAREHRADFDAQPESSLQSLGEFLQRQLSRLERRLPQAAYNLVLHTAPFAPPEIATGFDIHPYDHYHWHIEILPRVATLAGFEMGTGIFVNSVLPEDAATQLRETFPSSDENWVR
ncbi:MAG: hypothetical protein KDA99_13995 [Planctomycetales bacterium]|nr:hypothetical protein [Planctomycetales bacterium]